MLDSVQIPGIETSASLDGDKPPIITNLKNTEKKTHFFTKDKFLEFSKTLIEIPSKILSFIVTIISKIFESRIIILIKNLFKKIFRIKDNASEPTYEGDVSSLSFLLDEPIEPTPSTTSSDIKINKKEEINKTANRILKLVITIFYYEGVGLLFNEKLKNLLKEALKKVFENSNPFEVLTYIFKKDNLELLKYLKEILNASDWNLLSILKIKKEVLFYGKALGDKGINYRINEAFKDNKPQTEEYLKKYIEFINKSYDIKVGFPKDIPKNWEKFFYDISKKIKLGKVKNQKINLPKYYETLAKQLKNLNYFKNPVIATKTENLIITAPSEEGDPLLSALEITNIKDFITLLEKISLKKTIFTKNSQRKNIKELIENMKKLKNIPILNILFFLTKDPEMKESMRNILFDNLKRNFLFYGKIENKTSSPSIKNFISALDFLDYEKNKESIKIFISNVEENREENSKNFNAIFQEKDYESLFIELFA